MRKLSLSLLASASIAAGALAAPAYSADYKIDTEGMHASINFTVPHLGISFITGRFNDFEGSYVYDEENPENNSISVTVQTESIDTNHAERDKHVRSEDFMNTSEHPTASFSTSSYEDNGDGTGTLTGDLTFYGNTQEITVDVTKTGEGEDPWENYRTGFMGETTIDTEDFGMPSMFGNIPVELTIYVEGIRQ